jgi:hypothetical protein
MVLIELLVSIRSSRTNLFMNESRDSNSRHAWLPNQNDTEKNQGKLYQITKVHI